MDQTKTKIQSPPKEIKIEDVTAFFSLSPAYWPGAHKSEHSLRSRDSAAPDSRRDKLGGKRNKKGNSAGGGRGIDASCSVEKKYENEKR